MNPGSPAQLVPTYFGFIESTYDALVLFEACLTGHIAHVPRRPHDREREHVIKSGNIFIYEENTSGIKRWTDGVSWSPSRILGNFLIYRQLQKPFGPGEKKKALKKPKAPSAGITKNNSQPNGRPKSSIVQVFNNPSAASGAYGDASKLNPDVERALIGSLVDSYDFLDDGLVKKTISIAVNEVTHHLVSYYTLADAAARKFNIPSRDPKISHITPRPELTTKQNFRGPIEECDPLDRSFYGTRNRYDMTNQSMLQQHGVSYMAGADSHSSYPPSRPLFNSSYSMPTASTSYDGSTATYTAGPSFAGHYAPAPGIYPTPPQQQYGQESYGQRYSVSSGASSDGSRAQMPAAAEARRRSSAYQHCGSQDSGIVMAVDSRASQDASSTSDTYYQRPVLREPSVSGNAAGNATSPQSHRSLPSLQQSENTRPLAYERPPSNHYSVAMDARDPNHMWHMGGNVSIGHAHYQQQQWASAGN